MPNAPSLSIAAAGQLLSATADRVQGWAWAPDAPEQRLSVEILDDTGVVVATARAARFDRSLVVNGIGDGFHAFDARIPRWFFRKSEMLVRARAFGSLAYLDGGPLTAVRSADPSADIVMRLVAPDFTPRVAMAFAWPATNSGFRNTGSHEPNETIDFRTAVYGEGWEAAESGCRISIAGRATIKLSRLPDRPASLVLTVRASERQASRLRIHCDESELPVSVASITAADNVVVHSRLPATGAIRTGVTLTFEGEPGIVFTSLQIGPVPRS